MLGLFTGLDVLKRNASLAVRARKIYHTSQRRSALEALQRWRAHLEHRTHQQMQLEGAELMHAFRLCKRILTAWREVCKEEQVARYACARMNRVLARQALRQLGRVAATRLVLDEREKMGYRHWATRRAARALRLLLEHAVERNQSCDAAALRDVQRMRRAFGGWLSTVWLSKCERVAARHWRRVQTQRGLTALRLNWVSATATGAQGSLAAVFNRRRILSQYLGAWQSYYLEALESRIALHAADRVRRLRLSHTVFSAWRDFVFMRADLALAFDQVRTAKLAQTCLVAWHKEASCWIRHRNAVQRGQTRRAFLAWQEIAAAASLQRYELRLAAMFYRKCLLTRTFTLWVDFWYLQRYEGHVMGMAARHADSRLLRTVRGAWSETAYVSALSQQE
ncbi:Hypothetical Protein FCC1311_064072 [Hondaea fermentalgiana]|uniref:Sfi1 spindle body domain-containing protein n=1 Tax=Hondaea fermentalgiana TaxID=2315210 RepID=A0A2R5GH19_9STRA|nr:Hypothetical Protein FCC1311_064072 [Hondaea fermentalgiana]|eukprot:GBG30187.1 Hypothetical Protein FCC1311_064072 [Hondaea fermentalgiana]